MATADLEPSLFFRAAQATRRVGFLRIELLAAGGAGQKSAWARKFNGYYSWARYGFNTQFWSRALALAGRYPHLSRCRELLDVINIEPVWWKLHGDGCDLTFDLCPDSRSWYALSNYLSERGLK